MLEKPSPGLISTIEGFKERISVVLALGQVVVMEKVLNQDKRKQRQLYRDIARPFED